MKIICEVCYQVNKGIIRTDTYGGSMAKMLILWGEAQRYFPQLQSDEAEIKQYGGGRYKRTFGIEFDLPENAHVPEHFIVIDQLELTL